MDIYTVSFFGHRVLERMPGLAEKMERMLCDLIDQKKYIEFLVGREGDLVVCCIQHKSGGAYQTIRYAEKQNCRIVNLADID